MGPDCSSSPQRTDSADGPARQSGISAVGSVICAHSSSSTCVKCASPTPIPKSVAAAAAVETTTRYASSRASDGAAKAPRPSSW